jgi:lipopolysaccharide assembly outer membrane protein LptD (OstA)
VRTLVSAFAVFVLLAPAGPVRAQTPAPGQQQAPPEQMSDSLTVLNQKHYIRIGHVEVKENGTEIYADQMEFFDDENRALGTGNVLLVQGNNRISAERAEFNTKTSLGTFYNASGYATVQPPKQQPPRPGSIAPPPMASQDTIVYFFGETVEKVGPKKYKITKGGFSTCVQPTPRWDMHAETVLLNIEHYTVLKQAVMTVKGVPMLYLPIMFYPTKRGERATGFLLPTYGTSSLRGQSLHDAFYWAMDRSEDLTIMHDFYSKIGQGVGSEYRYNYGGGMDGNVRAFMLDQHAADYVQPNGSVVTTPAQHYFDIVGNANQVLPGNIRARAIVNYPSDIATSETFNTNVYDASRNQRTIGGNLFGAWGSYTMNATFNHSEYFYDANNSVLSGAGPLIAFNRSERPLFGTDLYFSVASQYAHLLSDSRWTSTVSLPDGSSQTLTAENNESLNRFDFFPQIRYPFKKWGWLTANSTVSWRDTFYSRILTPVDPTGTVQQTMTNEGFNRQFFNVGTQIVGPVFSRIWDTPDNGYAEKFKHSIEPFLTVQQTTNVENFDRIERFDGIDGFVGGTQYSYGVTNRFYAKRKLAPAQPGQAREIVDVELRQSYYTNQAAAQFDTVYQTTLIGGGTPSNFSPIQLNVRAIPTNDFNATMTMEFDSRYRALRTLSATGSYSWAQHLQTTIGWSKKGYIAQLPGFNDPRYLDQYINTFTTFRTKDNQYGTTYQFNYDVQTSTMLQQRITAFYNAQCCGLAFEYQTYNYPSFGGAIPIPIDHRFFLSFTLAGLGNFSPFNGALSGVPR